MELKCDQELTGNRKPWKTGGRVIREGRVARSNLHVNQNPMAAVGRVNWKGPVHMVRQVLMYKGTSQVSNWGVQSGPSVLAKEGLAPVASSHMGSILSLQQSALWAFWPSGGGKRWRSVRKLLEGKVTRWFLELEQKQWLWRKGDGSQDTEEVEWSSVGDWLNTRTR